MGIKQKPIYVAVCNSCDQYYHSPEGGAQCFEQPSECVTTITGAGWLRDGNRLYCPACCGGARAVN